MNYWISAILFSLVGVLYAQESDRSIVNAELERYLKLQKLSKIEYPGDSKIDVTYYKLDLEVSYESQYITGNVTVNANVDTTSIDKCFLDLKSSLTVDSVWLNGTTTNFFHANQELSIDLDRVYYPGENFSVQVFYQGHPVEKNNEEWGTPSMLGNEVNQFEPHWQASIADNQNLYFGGGADIYFSEFVNGNYTTAQKLGSDINTNDGLETTPFIAPDESYLIFARVHGSSLYSNLFISSKNNDGSWSEAIKMSGLSSVYHELYPNISPDGCFMMFLSLRSGLMLPYWVDAQVIYNYITDVNDENKSESPEVFQLYQNYPNPFNPTTKITYSIPKRSFVSLKVFDVLGNVVAVLVDKVKHAGEYEVEFNAAGLPSGIYINKIQTGTYSQCRKMLLIK